MTREDILTCVKIGAATATILAVLGGPIAYALYRLDVGVKESATQCEARGLADLAHLRNAQLNAYARFVNAKANIVAHEVGIDTRPTEQRSKPIVRSVEEQRRDDAWAEVERLRGTGSRLEQVLRDCPNYGGIIE